MISNMQIKIGDTSLDLRKDDYEQHFFIATSVNGNYSSFNLTKDQLNELIMALTLLRGEK